jgi:hypothetical protein
MPVMPDTRIPLSGDDGRQPNTSPFQTLGAMMQIKENQQQYEARRLENEKRRRDLEDDDDMQAALQSNERPEEAIQSLWKAGKSTAASRLSKDVTSARTSEWQEKDAQLKLQGDRIGHAGQLLGAAHDDASYQTIRPQVAKVLEPLYGAAINDYLPTQYGDGKQVKALITAGTTRGQQIEQQRGITQNWIQLYAAGAASLDDLMQHAPELLGPDGTINPNTAKWSENAIKNQDAQQEMLTRQLFAAPDQPTWDSYIAAAYHNGMPKAVVDKFADKFNPDQKKRHEFLYSQSMSVKDRAVVENAARNADRYEATEADRERRFRGAEARRAAAAAATAAGTNAGKVGGLTPDQRHNEENEITRDIQKTEDWVNENGPTSNLAGGIYDKLKKALTEAPQSKYAGVAREYIRRRVELEDRSRTRLQGVPPIADAAKKAVANNDRATFDKLVKVYHDITGGVGDLRRDIVAWPGEVSPEMKAKRDADIKKLTDQLNDSTLTPAQRQSLQAQLKQLGDSVR